MVGTVSIHPLKAADIGTPNRRRWFGIAPKSGFWQRKTGRQGKKNRPPPPVEVVEPEEPKRYREVLMTHHEHGRRGRKKGSKRRLNVGGW